MNATWSWTTAVWGKNKRSPLPPLENYLSSEAFIYFIMKRLWTILALTVTGRVFFLRVEAFLFLFLAMSFFLHLGGLFATFSSLGALSPCGSHFAIFFRMFSLLCFIHVGGLFVFMEGFFGLPTPPPPLQKLLRVHMY